MIDRQLEDMIEELDPPTSGPTSASFAFQNPALLLEETKRQKESCVKLLDGFIVSIFCLMALLIWKKFFVV